MSEDELKQIVEDLMADEQFLDSVAEKVSEGLAENAGSIGSWAGVSLFSLVLIIGFVAILWVISH